MFKSKVRPIVVPQYEHGKLAGSLAALWGNDDFARPVIDFTSFVRGVTLHDWGYGVVDNLPIGQVDEAEWLKVIRKGAEHRFDDPITDIVARLHLKRLLKLRVSPGREELVRLIEKMVEEQLNETHFVIEQFEWADKITRFCDQVAFDFSFEEPTEYALPVYTKADASEEATLTYKIKPGGEIWVDPWPFSVSAYSGIIIGYRQEGYPDRLQPEVINFHLRAFAE
jgi:hypothetical protein